MRQTLIAFAIATTAAAVTSVAVGAPQNQRAAIEAAVAAPTRTLANVARDGARHPVETLAFFGVEPDDTVVELYPGGGWYTEILAPYLASSGSLWVAAPMPNGVKGVQTLMAKDAATYGKLRVASFPAGDAKVPDGAADVVLTFRNIHNWHMGGAKNAQLAFAEAFRMLKPGGTFGVVEHRLPEARPDGDQDKSGYMKTSTVVAYARKAGFEVVGQSEVNANPKDTADWAQGVWTLPPVLRLKDQDRAKYEAIGESDRMTIRFRKPA
ncbi:class I SAM-dependent methyltransferase [Sphingomonas baiyangensis]|uniref:Methyltransferase domain-containing protein n=1 Tax=Sphingomonas baiyangensis TaxID=2572576 RepID=A0A4U1L1F7_9SPHN|nr:methyltransferase domain-containing protein [Sphingomonas baiyangensis]TKD50677.1 methyltransferase domain-containing protein [Sphingomonas baiyangensis]